jgi:hypothetical protein|tara:strand:+ start:369 stop:620 length:252 start_codon:yes stop_codon:yes gene_type:complete
MISRKGQGLSINVIIIAAIALLVLVILAFLIAKAGTKTSEGTTCIYEGGVCKENCNETNRIAGIGEHCSKSVEYCCSPVPINT